MNSIFFAYMNSLASVYLYMSFVPSWNVSMYQYSLFYNTPMVNSNYLGYFGSIYVPSSLYSIYKTSTGWNNWSSRYVSMSDADYQ